MSDYWAVEADRWLKDAEEDMRIAELLLEAGHYAASCFHSQQCGEKALKAALCSHGVEARGPSAYQLLEGLGEISDSDVGELREQARLLDRHYSPTRYPNLHPGTPLPAHELYGRRDAEACVEAARSVLEFVKRSLSG